MVYSARVNPGYSYDDPSNATEHMRRISYTLQAIIARKFSSRFSFELLPTMVHRNFIENPEDDNNIFALGAGGRIKVTRSMAIVADYIYNFSPLRKVGNDNGYYNAFGAGLE